MIFMMRSPLSALLIATALACVFLAAPTSSASAGYHYDRPASASARAAAPITHFSSTGHSFAPLPTIIALPPVPALPALPTARPGSGGGARVQTQTLLQVHPAPQKSIAAAYRPPSATAPHSNYLPPNGGAPPAPNSYAITQFPQTYQAAAPTGFGQRLPLVAPPPPPQAPAPPQPAPPAAPTASGPIGILAPRIPPSPATLQPLRIPFGKQAIVHFPTTAGFTAPSAPTGFSAPGGDYLAASSGAGQRPLKQYAVIEIIDNDIEQTAHPFLSRPLFDNYRAQFGASGTGATAPATFSSAVAGGGVQLQSRTSALRQEQQRLASAQPQQQNPLLAAASSDAIALGSGGLGYIRLANGNVYLGSGSLGYISGQQRSQLLRDARTRSGAPMPDALHFGHGPLGSSNSNFRFK